MTVRCIGSDYGPRMFWNDDPMFADNEPGAHYGMCCGCSGRGRLIPATEGRFPWVLAPHAPAPAEGEPVEPIRDNEGA